MKQELNKRSTEKGFTLVELAIVMIIIGLLIGGILKGQELIANASLTSTVSQVKAVDAATSTFKDMYNAFPGDMTNPTVRIAGCTGAAAGNCAFVGNGDGQITDDPGEAKTGESQAFWLQLEAADVLSVGGQNWLPAEIGGNFAVGYSTGLPAEFPLASADATVTYRTGHYLALSADTTGAIAAADQILTANEAARIDAKLDDSRPNAGTVRAGGNVVGGAAGTNCTDAATLAGVYAEATTADNCVLYIRFQQ